MLENNDISKRLRDLRESHGLTQYQLAQQLNVYRTTVVSWESDRYDGKPSTIPNADMLDKLATLYGVSVDYILCRSDFKTPENEYISSLTGLTDKACSQLRLVRYGQGDGAPFFPDVMSALLESQNLEYFLALLQHRFSFDSSKESDLATVNLDRGQKMTVKVDGLIDSVFATHLLQDLPDLAESYKRILNAKKAR